MSAGTNLVQGGILPLSVGGPAGDAYAPADPGNWNPVPTTEAEGLDTLALRGTRWIFGASGLTTSTTVRYLEQLFGGGPAPTVESLTRFRIERTGVINRLSVIHGAAGGGAILLTYTLNVNTIATAMVVSTLATSTAQANFSAASLNVSAGDYVTIAVTKAAALASSPSDVRVAFEIQ